MNLHRLSLTEIEGPAPPFWPTLDLSQAADAAEAAGIDDDLGRIGAPVAKRISPALSDAVRSADPMVNLSSFNAPVCGEVSGLL